MAHTVTALSKSSGVEVTRVSGVTATASGVAYGLGPNKPLSWGASKVGFARIDVTAYVTGGVTITPESMGLNSISAIVPVDAIVLNGAAVHFARASPTDASKLMLIDAAGAEVANGADGGDLRVMVIGQ